MKRVFFSSGVLLAAVCALGSALRAAEQPNTPAALAAEKKQGYTVLTQIKVDEKGETTDVAVIESNDATTGKILEKLALAMAAKSDLPPREKNGKPAKYTVRAPFFFPIQDDEGPESDNGPKPKLKQAVQPVYPEKMWLDHQVGGAIFELVVDKEGKLTRVTPLRASHPEFQAAAQEALEKWEFSPAKDGDTPVESRVRLAIVFEDTDKMAEVQWRVPPRPMLGSWFVLRSDQPIEELEGAMKEAADGENAAEAPPAEAEKK